MKDYCVSCVYFTPISEEGKVGYCSMLGIGIYKNVAILDLLSTLAVITEKSGGNSEIYNHIIVESGFGCICYKRINMM